MGEREREIEKVLVCLLWKSIECFAFPPGATKSICVWDTPSSSSSPPPPWFATALAGGRQPLDVRLHIFKVGGFISSSLVQKFPLFSFFSSELGLLLLPLVYHYFCRYRIYGKDVFAVFHQKVQKGKLVIWLKDEEKEAVCDKKKLKDKPRNRK